jgi:signal peptide peptidase SppA
MPRQHAIDRVLAMALEPWAITTPMLGIVAGVLARRLAGRTDAASDTTFVTRPAIAPPTGTGMAIIPIHGVIAPRINLLSDISGGATFEEATQQLHEALATPTVGTIVLDWDSPGGSVAGATEFAREILKARTVKPVVSVANFQMCSAAYWTGACATEIVAAPSAMLGSIGVYTIHEDLSKALDLLGVKVTYISAGKYKIDGNETAPLSDSAHTRIQAIVDAMYSKFVGDVALGRGKPVDAIISGYGQGAVVTADEALALGMVDRIATLDDTVARIQSTTPQMALRAATVQAPTVDTPQEPLLVTGQDRRHGLAALEAELFALEF